MSILVAQDGLYFCISTNGENIIDFRRQVFPNPESPENILSELQSVLDYYFNPEDLKTLDEIKVYYAHPYFALVPRPYFLEDKLSDYLKFNTRLLSTDEITYDRLEGLNANMVYVPFTNINNYLVERFGSFDFQHAVSCFVNQCTAQVEADKNQVFLQIYPHHFDCCIFKNGKLQLCNSYEWYAAEDLVYYTLFAYEQLKLDPEKDPLYLGGEIEEEDDAHDLLYTYIRHVEFLEPIQSMKIEAAALQDVPDHKIQFLINTLSYANRLRKV